MKGVAVQDSKSWIEIVIFLLGWVAIVAALRQQARDLSSKVDQGQREAKERADKMSEKIDSLVGSLSILGSQSSLHGEQITTLRSSMGQMNRDTVISTDELKGDLSRHGRIINKHEKWIAVANSELKRLSPTWEAPINGD